MDKFKQAKQRLQCARSILIVSHIRPDGDAVGSVLGLGLALQDAGKYVQMVLDDGVPKTFRHLTGSRQIQKRPNGEFDVIVVVDSSGLDRIGYALDGYPVPDLNIDHHVTNLNFAEINLVDSQAAATTEMLSKYLPQWGLSITKPIAEALLTGLITDTIGFQTPNVHSQTLRTAASLMEKGADISTLYRKVLVNRPFAAVNYWGFGLRKLQIEDRVVWASLTLDDRNAAHYPGSGDADLVNILASIDDADIALIFIEQPEGQVKISWRAKPGFDVSKVASQFGGGGHKPAAGVTIEGELDEIQTKVLEATHTLFNGRVTNS
ncbi:MAG: bifunctional oligoribonuclease/PAP phosphatase NrnA [Chloroflexota bacterium]|nr:bifunctional oligoribonuclease/PAP phosphatase NrnA [Chloroflexota bacterium]